MSATAVSLRESGREREREMKRKVTKDEKKSEAYRGVMRMIKTER